MTPSAKAELDGCIAHAAEIGGDGHTYPVMIGVYLGPKGRPVSVAILQSSGSEQVDKLVLRCIYRGHYTPTEPGKPAMLWIFTAPLKVNPANPSPAKREVA